MSDEREKNRREFPTVAKIVDEIRKRFPTAKLIYGVEPDGREIGSRAAHEERVRGAV